MQAPTPHRTGQLGSMWRRGWPFTRALLGAAVVVLAGWVLSSHTDELAGLGQVLRRLDWWWVVGATVTEFLSFASFTRLQSGLLRFGGLQAPGGPLLKTTFASQALTNSLPGGTAVSAVYSFRWYRRFGAGNTLATWAITGVILASIISLALVAALGLALATEQGATLDLVPAIVGVLAVAMALGALFVYGQPILESLDRLVRASRSVTGRPPAEAETRFQRSIRWITSVHLSGRQITTTVLWGTANWLFDCACFAMMFPAIGVAVPWKGLLLAYGAGQLATALPITPGGLGAVEGSITIALVAFGGAQTTTVEAVLLYRTISFWLVLAVGWALFGKLALEVREGRWSRRALSAPVEAGPGRDPAPSPPPSDGSPVGP